MAKRGKNNYYAIVRSRDAPAIYSSWAIAQSKVNGYSNAIYEGFKTLNEAKSFMENNGCCNYEVWDDDVKGERAPKEGEVVYYAVARGRRSGVYEHYSSMTSQYHLLIEFEYNEYDRASDLQCADYNEQDAIPRTVGVWDCGFLKFRGAPLGFTDGEVGFGSKGGRADIRLLRFEHRIRLMMNGS